MKEHSNIFESDENQNSFPIKEFIIKYFRYWKWFLIAGIIGLFLGLLFLRYAREQYSTVAKIRIIDNSSQTDIASETVSNLWQLSNVNVDNEIEVLKSHRIISQVVSELQLDVSYFYKGRIKTNEIWNAPFKIRKNISEDNVVSPLSYDIELDTNGFIIKDMHGQEFNAPFKLQNTLISGLPFSIQLIDGITLDDYKNNSYKVVLYPKKLVAMHLSNSIRIAPIKKKGDIVAIWLDGENPNQSEVTINTLVEKYNQDVILDRQLVSKRTLDFIDERFLYLTSELDSIESGKQNFKKENNLSYIEDDATHALSAKSNIEEELFALETQISLSNLLKKTVVEEKEYSLLPADVGLENNSLNNLVSDYNDKSLKRAKLLSSVGSSHPSLQLLNGQLQRGRDNILKTVNVYQKQLGASLYQLKQEKNKAGSIYSTLPEKEKILRSIERQQSIKENLFLLLLQKREEAAINHAVTASSVKIVDYALTSVTPIFPQRKLVIIFSILLCVLFPFVYLFIKFYLDDKIYDKKELFRLNSSTAILGEIPFFPKVKNILYLNSRSVYSESFRVLCSNIEHYFSNKIIEKTKVIYVSSSIKGEGKTLVALNLAAAYSNLNKKVLLVGADLRNPQIHSYIKEDKNKLGLSDYLNGSVGDWKDNIIDGFEKGSLLKVFMAGSIVLNPTELLSNERFNIFISEVKKEFDYIVVDTAPSMLVSDTALISKHSDLTLFIVRAGFTNKRLVEFSKDLFDSNKLSNMCYVLNNSGLGENNYNYGYGYGYGSEDANLENDYYTKFSKIKKKIISSLNYLLKKISKK